MHSLSKIDNVTYIKAIRMSLPDFMLCTEGILMASIYHCPFRILVGVPHILKADKIKSK